MNGLNSHPLYKLFHLNTIIINHLSITIALTLFSFSILFILMFLVFKIIFNFTSSTFKNVHKKTLTKLRNDISF